ncbi:MAG TPA: alanine--tRNA ligase, partial [Dehalococcoidia bacterium]|nr:alanine--tRNA ligase [Dehalococcoidia bacterium]
SSLIPPPDERTLLFSNAGMNQMKPYFMGLAEAPSRRMTSIQKCFRTSDIEEVGDATHCTFFEMLGNFSVGDYFKAEIIPWAWELLTEPQPKGMGLDKSRIWTTVFLDDDEAYDLWRGVGIPAERIVRFDESENYWFMIKGGAGPCGPNTEIYYDFGADQGCGDPGCSPPTHDCGRFVELWNLVFMTLYQDEDGSRRPLPMRNVDTGGGLERWTSAHLWQEGIDWQGKKTTWAQPPTIYDGDLFRPILAQIEWISDLKYDAHQPAEHTITRASIDMRDKAMRILAEHTRAATLLIADGVMPGNDGRGSVLRRLIRRAMYFGSGVTTDLGLIAEAVIERMAPVIPEVKERSDLVIQVLRDEERRFNETMQRGMVELNAELSHVLSEGGATLQGDRAFYFEATLGFPIELTREIATDRGILVDDAGYERAMERHRAVSSSAQRFDADSERLQTYAELGLHATEFVGYETTRAFGQVAAILLDGTTIVRELTPQLAASHHVEVVVTQTPFYAEGGGQVGDRGEIVWPGGRFVVEDTQHVGDGGVVAHIGRLESGTLSAGDPIEGRVDESLRGDTMRNHTATHILHAALRNLLGTHVRQAGSLVTPDRLRFDFTHLEAMTPEQIREVEALANRVVRDNLTVHIEHKSYEEALADGALAFFGDKYADVVRVVGVCDLELHDCFSHELCGGTHVHASGEVGAIIITGETSIGAGMRRIEAVTGRAAAERLRADEDTIGRLSTTLMAPPAEIEAKVAALREENARLHRQLQTLERRAAREASQTIAATQIGETSVVVERVEAATADALREVGDGLKATHKSAIILLGAVIDDKPAFVAMSTPDVAKRCPAGEVVRAAAQAAGGNGGGRPESAQGGGTDPSKLDAALAAARKLIEEKLTA